MEPAATTAAIACAMRPVLLEWAGMTVSAYPFMIAFGVALLFWRVLKDGEAAGLPRAALLATLVAGYIGGLSGARLFFVVEHRSLLVGDWWTWLFNPVAGGFSSYGGVLGGSLVAALAARTAGLPVRTLLDAGTVGLCCFGAVGRVGCYLAGCCYGRAADVPGGIHPVQLYESAFLIVLATVLVRVPSLPAGERFLWLVASYSGGRLLLDQFRGDALIPRTLLSTAQWISLVLLVPAVFLLWKLLLWKRRFRCVPHQSADGSSPSQVPSAPSWHNLRPSPPR